MAQEGQGRVHRPPRWSARAATRGHHRTKRPRLLHDQYTQRSRLTRPATSKTNRWPVVIAATGQSKDRPGDAFRRTGLCHREQVRSTACSVEFQAPHLEDRIPALEDQLTHNARKSLHSPGCARTATQPTSMQPPRAISPAKAATSRCTRPTCTSTIRCGSRGRPTLPTKTSSSRSNASAAARAPTAPRTDQPPHPDDAGVLRQLAHAPHHHEYPPRADS